MIFEWEQREENKIITKNRKQIRYLNIFNIINISTLLSADAKSAILLSVPSLTRVEGLNFSLLPFSRWFCLVNFLCNVWKGLSYLNFSVSVSLIFNNGQFYLKYYFLHQRNPPSLKGFSEVSIAMSLFSFFTKMLKPLQFFIFITLGRTSESLPKHVLYWPQHTDFTETSFLSTFFKMLFCITVFSMLAIRKPIDI